MKTIRILAVAFAYMLISNSAALGQISYFDRYISFGDSLSDTGRVRRETGYDAYELALPGFYAQGRSSNAPAFTEVVPGAIGLPYNAADGYAVSGARVVRQPPDDFISPFFPYGVPDQIDQALARSGRFGPRDLVNMWIGYNDIFAVGFGTAGDKANAVTTILTGTVDAIARLAGAGVREFVVFNQKTDRLDFAYLTVPDGGRDVAQAVNAALPSALAPLAASGLNIRYFDIDALITRVRANPQAFGFGPDANNYCLAVAACREIGIRDGGTVMDQYISPDGQHLTGRMNTIVSAFLTNQLNAPFTVAPQISIGETAGRAFAGSLLNRLDASRQPESSMVGSPRPLSVFALGSFASGDRKASRGADGYRSEHDGGTLGIEYRVNRNVLVGAALNIAQISADLTGRGGGDVKFETAQGALFASLNKAGFFADAVLALGTNRYDLSRRGALDGHLTASPTGRTLTLGGKLGYSFDVGELQIGPVAGLSIVHTRIDRYRERGDALLTIGVGQQHANAIVGSAGIQMRTTLQAGGARVSPYLNLTAEHGFAGGARTIQTFQTYAPDFLIRTKLNQSKSETYAKLSGGTAIDFNPQLSLFLSAYTGLGSGRANDRGLDIGLSYRF